MLQWLGTWFVKQTEAYERAFLLFSHASSDSQLDLLDALSKFAVLLEHPGLHEGSWDSFLKQQIGSRGLSVKKGKIQLAGSHETLSDSSESLIQPFSGWPEGQFWLIFR
jgi:hypothetical protein